LGFLGRLQATSDTFQFLSRRLFYYTTAKEGGGGDNFIMKGESRLIVGDKELSSGPVGINHLELLLTATTTPPPHPG